MQYTNLGRTGLRVSRLALGTMNFGELTGETASFEIMDTAIEAGINFFDTADVYGGPQSPDMEKGFGTSEEIIGRWLAQRAALSGANGRGGQGNFRAVRLSYHLYQRVEEYLGGLRLRRSGCRQAHRPQHRHNGLDRHSGGGQGFGRFGVCAAGSGTTRYC
jgi:Aldo/keto reductase family